MLWTCDIIFSVIQHVLWQCFHAFNIVYCESAVHAELGLIRNVLCISVTYLIYDYVYSLLLCCKNSTVNDEDVISQRRGVCSSHRIDWIYFNKCLHYVFYFIWHHMTWLRHWQIGLVVFSTTSTLISWVFFIWAFPILDSRSFYISAFWLVIGELFSHRELPNLYYLGRHIEFS